MLAAPATTSADSQSPARPNRPARRNASAATPPPTISTTADRDGAETSNRINAPFRDWLPTDVM